MPTVYQLISDLKPHWLDTTGAAPAAGYKLFVYGAGTSEKKTSYLNSAGLVTNANPIVLDARGEPPSGVYVEQGSFKLVLAPDNDTDPPTSPVWTRDNIIAGEGSGGTGGTGGSVDQWIETELTPTYISATSFSVVGSHSDDFTVGRRVQINDSGGIVYGVVTAVAEGGGITTVTVLLDSGVIDTGISQVDIGFLEADHSAIPHTQSDADGLTFTGDVTLLARLAAGAAAAYGSPGEFLSAGAGGIPEWVSGSVSVVHDEDLAGESSVIMTGLVPNTFYIVILANLRPFTNTTRYQMRVTVSGTPISLSDDYQQSRVWYSGSSSPGVPEANSGVLGNAIIFPSETVQGHIAAQPQTHAVWWVSGLGDDINTNFKGIIHNPHRVEIDLQVDDVFRATVHDGIEIALVSGTDFETGRCTILGVPLA